jgi:chemotaxis protein methyltransferase CheR
VRGAPDAGPFPRGREAPAETVEDVEVRLLAEGIYRVHGYDFRDYAQASLRRRIRHLVREDRLSSISALQERVLHDPLAFQRFVEVITVQVTSMFRDPKFYLLLRQKVLPLLRTYPLVRVWHAGCSTGEEVYSLAILLEEEGLYERCRIYATDMSSGALKRAESGAFPLGSMRDNTANYRAAGGRGSFARFYKAVGDRAVFQPSLGRNVVFAQHNLVTDQSFNEFNVVLCRNVLIYFNRPLQERVHHLLYTSLGRFGFLGLGARENVRFTPHEKHYQDIGEKIYRKVA